MGPGPHERENALSESVELHETGGRSPAELETLSQRKRMEDSSKNSEGMTVGFSLHRVIFCKPKHSPM